MLVRGHSCVVRARRKKRSNPLRATCHYHQWLVLGNQRLTSHDSFSGSASWDHDSRLATAGEISGAPWLRRGSLGKKQKMTNEEHWHDPCPPSAPLDVIVGRFYRRLY